MRTPVAGLLMALLVLGCAGQPVPPPPAASASAGSDAGVPAQPVALVPRSPSAVPSDPTVAMATPPPAQVAPAPPAPAVPRAVRQPSALEAGGVAVSVLGTPFYLALKTAFCAASVALAAPAAGIAALGVGPHSEAALRGLGDGVGLNCGPPYVLTPPRHGIAPGAG